MHQFHILKMILSRPRRHLRYRVSNMLVERRREFIERPKKMIVSRLYFCMPIPHRPRIHHLVVKNAILVRALCPRLIFVAIAGVARRPHQL